MCVGGWVGGRVEGGAHWRIMLIRTTACHGWPLLLCCKRNLAMNSIASAGSSRAAAFTAASKATSRARSGKGIQQVLDESLEVYLVSNDGRRVGR